MSQELEDYIYMLGLTSVQLKGLAEVQHNAINGDYLQDDETDQARVVKYCIVQAFAATRTLLEMINEHTTINVEEVAKRFKKRMKKK